MPFSRWTSYVHFPFASDLVVPEIWRCCTHSNRWKKWTKDNEPMVQCTLILYVCYYSGLVDHREEFSILQRHVYNHLFSLRSECMNLGPDNSHRISKLYTFRKFYRSAIQDTLWNLYDEWSSVKTLTKNIRSTVHQFYFRGRSIFRKGAYSSNVLGASVCESCELLSFVREFIEIEGSKVAYARMRAKQTKPAISCIYKYLFDRNAPLCMMINEWNW